MSNLIHDAFTTLPGATRCHFLRLVEGPTSWWLQAFNLREGNVQIELTHAQLRALLQAVEAANPFLALDDRLEEAEMHAKLRRLHGTDHYA